MLLLVVGDCVCVFMCVYGLSACVFFVSVV